MKRHRVRAFNKGALILLVCMCYFDCFVPGVLGVSCCSCILRNLTLGNSALECRDSLGFAFNRCLCTCSMFFQVFLIDFLCASQRP